MGKIVIVDDDLDIARLISDALEDEHLDTIVFDDAIAAQNYIYASPQDISLITLDIMMPELSGLDLCRTIRDKVDCPIIFVSAKGKTLDTVLGLEMGADDYITKPFVVEEFVARVKAHLRREKRSNALPEEGVIRVGEIQLRVGSYEVFKNGKSVQFSTREFQLLQYLMENVGKVLTREQIFRMCGTRNSAISAPLRSISRASATRSTRTTNISKLSGASAINSSTSAKKENCHESRPSCQSDHRAVYAACDRCVRLCV